VESVVAITDGGNLRSFSSQGAHLWNYYARGRLTTHLRRSREGTSYICRTNGILIAVNRAGRELWQINLGTALVSPVLIGWDGRLFVFTDRKLTCMTAAGYTLWSKTFEKQTALPPVMDLDGGVIVVQEDGEILKIDPFGKTDSWPAGAVPAAALSMEAEDELPGILLVFEDRHLEFIYCTLGYKEFLRGRLELPAPPLAAAGINAAGKRDEAAILLKDGRVALVSLTKRSILWVAESHIGPGELPGGINLKSSGTDIPGFFYDERGIYVLTNTGASGFAPDGRRLWNIRLKEAAGIPSFGDDGILFSGGSDWILYAYRIEERVRVKQNLLYGEAPPGTYGTGEPGPSSMADFYYRFSEAELEARLSEIRSAIREGNVGTNEKEYAAWLMETAGSVIANPRLGNRPPVHTRYRVDAARLLAFIGSRETIPFLADLFIRDNEVLVKAAAAEAIGRIGVDPEGFALRAFESVIFPYLRSRDETLLYAIAAATGALCRFSGPPLSAAGVRILTYLSGDDKPSACKNRARLEITSINTLYR
jgi:outer membrane protein assembly factor BamB